MKKNPSALVLLLLMMSHAVPGQTWWGTSAPTGLVWESIACSADGMNVVAASGYPLWDMYRSTNGGATWSQGQSLTANYMASSADGTRLAAVQGNEGYIFVSTDGGTTWTQSSSPQANWSRIACSTNGTKWAAIGQLVGGGPSEIFLSTDSGMTWAPSSAAPTNWAGIACSADGTRLVAATGGNGAIYTSIDAGATWTRQTVPAIWWVNVVSSSDGMKLAAATTAGGGIYTSADSGTNWTLTGAPPLDWNCMACSADGTKLIVGVDGGFGPGEPGAVYTSSDFGATWSTTTLSNEFWTGVACSADGSQLFACSANFNPDSYLPSQIITSSRHLWMTVTQTGGNIAVLWPWPSENCTLQQNSGSSTNWSAVTNTPVFTNLEFEVVLPKSGQEGLFRLWHTPPP